MNKKMRAAQVCKAGGDWELVERDIPEPRVGALANVRVTSWIVFKFLER
jgi:hypothetical protein